ncbi:MAG TPA: 4-hydroxy-tetrahydrodipicolinate reductase [Actinomycetota bacterium]|nr:4-hydroxy-tetrahydrodipicolinate reductase [Actinomycetota bacterium]
MIRVGVFGAAGRMGAEVCRAVDAADDLELVAAVDIEGAGGSVAGQGISDDPATLVAAGAEVAVDFTVAASAVRNIRWCTEHGVHAVVGTSGIGAADLAEFAGSRTGVFIAPNFAIGAVLMMHFARVAAAWMPAAEVIELHHEGKRDSPSGTSLATVRAIAAGRAGPAPAGPPDPFEVVGGARGAEQDGVRVHSVRLPGYVAHQEVLFGAPGETLTIRHDTTDRVSFMPGVLLAVREVAKHPGLTVGLEALLGL